ncbi:hypothetical protein AB3N04_13210 [Alkalihalophilus sp. As8PL]|uniref:Uncharacterized protein n=1 Tax=Alkalihalophilus sp. As8PL TaxID=3237103 RepID=A0AB39BQ01_9BACI
MGNWYRLPKSEGIFLSAIIIYAVIFFLPWSYDVMIMNITLQAWGAYGLHILAPVIAIYLIMQNKETKVTADRKQSLDT